MKNHILAKSIALLAGLAALPSAFAANAVLSDDTTIHRTLPRASYHAQPTLSVVATAQGVGRMAYAKSDLSNTVTQFDCTTGAHIDTTPVGTGPFGLCFDGTAVWVANKTSNNLLRR